MCSFHVNMKEWQIENMIAKNPNDLSTALTAHNTRSVLQKLLTAM